jgi:hypothetical protein
MKGLLLFLLFFYAYTNGWSQKKYPDRLKVYVDCLNGCDMTFIRSEINIIDFSLDRQAADVHVLINDQNTGSGGDEYQLIFIGQNQFKNTTDTLRFYNEANNTDFEERDLLLKYLKLGLTPFIAKTGTAGAIDIKMKADKTDSSAIENNTVPKKDKWNYWVINTGLSGNINKDEVYQQSRFNGEVAVTRITEEMKIGFEFDGSKTKSEFEYDDDNGDLQKIVIRNNEFSLEHFFVKSINQHWSWAYQAELGRNTFSNFKSNFIFRAGIEYNIFPYKMVNTKKFTLAYILNARRNIYYDTTLYDKTKESLFGQSLEAKFSVNQKWGRIYISSSYRNFFHDWKFFNLAFRTTFDIRITGGLSFYIFSGAELVRDQLYLPKQNATSQEVLTRRRQLASGYQFYMNFGFNYRFGSLLNNFVNPRFD